MSSKAKTFITFHFTNNKIKLIIYLKYKCKMNGKIKYVDIKSCTYYFFDDIINIKSVDLSTIEINEKPCKNIVIY